MRFYKSAILLFFYLITHNAYSATNEFNLMCQIFTEAENSSLTLREKSKYITENIDQRITSKVVKDVIDAVRTLPPHLRYAAIKESAEAELEQDWTCSSMKKIYDTNQPPQKNSP